MLIFQFAKIGIKNEQCKKRDALFGAIQDSKFKIVIPRERSDEESTAFLLRE